MTMHLEDYQELLDDLPGESQEVLRASWNEAARMFSSRGLDNYLKGAVALHNLGRRGELVVTYIQEMPEVSRAIGEEVLPDVVNFLMAMASKTSGQVLTLIVGTAPLAAQSFRRREPADRCGVPGRRQDRLHRLSAEASPRWSGPAA